MLRWCVCLCLVACGSDDTPGQGGTPTRPAGKDTTSPAAVAPSGEEALPPTPVTPSGPIVTLPSGPTVIDPHTWMPSKQGLWIWRWDYTGRTPREVATIAQDAGVGWVLIKSGQDERFWDTRYNNESLAEFTSRGMPVFAWPYVTMEDIPGSITAVVAAANVAGTLGVILDVEGEWEVAGSGAKAIELCDGIRAAKPDIFLGYTSYGWVDRHGSFPFREFDTHCGDAFMPQVYWSDRGVTYQRGYDEAVTALNAAHFRAPIWMAQSNDKIYKGGEPTTLDINAFFELSGPRSSLWVFPNSGNEPKVQQLYEINWAAGTTPAR